MCEELYFRAHLKTTAKQRCFTKCVNCQMNTFTEIKGIETTLRDIFLTKVNEK